MHLAPFMADHVVAATGDDDRPNKGRGAVTGTIMVEPTESEDLRELESFIAAMIGIRAKIRQTEAGIWSAEDNPLKPAPDSQADITGDWSRAYSREQAVFPLPWVADNKSWPSVNRIDDLYGDRNLF